MTDKTEDYESLMAAYFSGEATPDEIMRLSAWLTEDQVNIDIFESFRNAWLLTGKDALSSNIDIDSEWQNLESRMDKKTMLPPSLPANTPHRSIIKLFSSWKAAAAIVILLVAAAAAFYFNKGPEMVMVTADKNNYEQVLPDGSVITLASGAEIKYSETFSEEYREVSLKGEAYFEVKPDTKRPFIVSDNDVRIEVLGTSFNVNTKAGDHQTSVVLTSGKVSLYFEGNKTDGYILNPGEKAEIRTDKKSIIRQINSDPNYMAWKTGKIVFDNTGLVQVVATLCNVYHTEFRLADPQLSGCSLTATFENQSLEQVLNVIKATLDLKITNVQGIIILGGSGCY
jgi:transmembrane sensor